MDQAWFNLRKGVWHAVTEGSEEALERPSETSFQKQEPNVSFRKIPSAKGGKNGGKTTLLHSTAAAFVRGAMLFRTDYLELN